MARMPDGLVVTVEADKLEVRLKESRELVMCKNCKHYYLLSNRVPAERTCSIFGLDVAPDFYCKNGERRENE